MRNHPHYFVTDAEVKQQAVQSLEKSFNDSTTNILRQIGESNSPALAPALRRRSPGGSLGKHKPPYPVPESQPLQPLNQQRKAGMKVRQLKLGLLRSTHHAMRNTHQPAEVQDPDRSAELANLFSSLEKSNQQKPAGLF